MEVRKGSWTKEEDHLLTNYIEKHGEGRWHKVPLQAVCLSYGRPHRFTVRISVRSPPYGAGKGAPPPQRTLAASQTTLHPRRVRRILVFRPDHLELQTKSIWPENGNSADSPGMERGRGSSWRARLCWGGGAPSPAPYGGERRKIRP
ncbi:hypothetical protein ACLB2K_001795 [Fragaria x ananassa]